MHRSSLARVRPPALLVLVLALAVASTAAGCSDDPDPSPTPSSRTSGPASSASPATPSPTATGGGANPSTSTPPLPPGGAVPRGFTPTSVSTTRGVVYVLGTAPCSQAPCTSLVRLADGAWRGLAAPRAALAGPVVGFSADSVSEVRFADPLNGWAFGSALWSTHDGGRTWTRRNVGGPVEEVVSDGRYAYAVSPACVGSCSTSRLLRTPAGSDTWTQVATGRGFSVVLGGGSGLTDVGGLKVLRNGAWVAATTPCRNAPETARLAASASGSRLFVFCSEGGAAGSIGYTPYASDDGGRSWRPTGGNPLVIGNSLISLTAASPSVLLASSGDRDRNGRIQRSTDGGRTWAVVTGGGLPDLDGGDGDGWRYVGASGADRIVAVPFRRGPSYWVSADGATWTAVTPR